ncbi:hypothetical protein Q9L58_005911, partial [Maublancomyces gigas]
TGIPRFVLNEIRTCYNLLATSKRCCPVCAATISFLSAEAEAISDDSIHALSKHSIIFPCAFPIGLPPSIREKLLERYRLELHLRLVALVKTDRRSSSKSAQSATSSDVGSGNNKLVSKKRMLRRYQYKWGNLDVRGRKACWAEARLRLPLELLES